MHDIGHFLEAARLRIALCLLVLLASFLGPLSHGFAAAASSAAHQCGLTTFTVPLPDPTSGRRYQLFVSLPDGFDPASATRHPLLLMADGGRAFPKHICEIREVTKADGKDLVVIGLGYAEGESLEDSRRRDYTPTPQPSSGHVYGQSDAYQTYLKGVVIPFVEMRYHTDPARRIFWGHSYGGLLAATMLFDQPGLFQTYIIGSPSLWYDNHAILTQEKQFAAEHHRIPAKVFLYVGGKEVRRYDAARKGLTQDMVGDARYFESLLSSRHYEGLSTQFRIVPDRDHVSSVGPGITWGLHLALQPDL
jgi:uncharacterized protein